MSAGAKAPTLPAIFRLVNGCYGVNVPRQFGIYYLHLWEGVSAEEAKILKAGADDLTYWETWDRVMSNATLKAGEHTWTLIQTSDLFAICDELMTPEERLKWLGEPSCPSP